MANHSCSAWISAPVHMYRSTIYAFQISQIARSISKMKSNVVLVITLPKSKQAFYNLVQQIDRPNNRPIFWVIFENNAGLDLDLLDGVVHENIRNKMNYVLFQNAQRFIVKEFWNSYNTKSVVSNRCILTILKSLSKFNDNLCISTIIELVYFLSSRYA